MVSTLTKQINMAIYFENLIVKLHVLKIYVKFHANRMLFYIIFIYIFFTSNSRLQKLEI